MAPNELDLKRLKEMMSATGVTQLYLKRLAENDNSKNQVYLGPDLTALNVLPNGPLAADPEKPALLKSPLHFSWLTSSGSIAHAPGAQLILYPQYPEVRFSGFLKGCQDAPSKVMTIRQAGRILFFGIAPTGQIIGFAADFNSLLSKEIAALDLVPDNGVFSRITVDAQTDDKKLLLSELARISELGWIDSKRLNKHGDFLPCPATNCGGLTLEAELGVRSNSLSEPDFHGWEIKQYGVTNLARPASGGRITLMTPEPTGGVYAEDGIREFIRRFGYPDRVIADRRNFGGVHTALKVCAKTDLKLTLDGYDLLKNTITDFSRGISLLSSTGEIAALWRYKDLLGHWTRKHALAAYVPSINRKNPVNQYQFGAKVRLAEGTEFRLFLKAVASGAVYYDPGIKIVNVSSERPEVKKRSQFRINSSAISQLYSAVSEFDLDKHK